MPYYFAPLRTIKSYEHYAMHLFGIIAFLSTFGLSILAFIKHFDTDHKELALLLLYGFVIFFFNLFYLKAMRLSREDYESKLKKEKEYSQALLQAQKNFLRHAVHETNTPLAVIMANIELYEMEQGKHHILQNIEAATKNIFGIYDDLNYLVQQEKIVYPRQAIVLSEFIKSRIAFFDIVAKQSNLTFVVHDRSEDASVFFNTVKLQRIIDNNLSNAMKYSQEYRDIEIILTNEETYINFEIISYSSMIQDTEQIFDAYYRESEHKTGLGLGLNLVKSICDEEGVRVSLSSTETCTSFKYYFKRVEP